MIIVGKFGRRNSNTVNLSYDLELWDFQKAYKVKKIRYCIKNSMLSTKI